MPSGRPTDLNELSANPTNGSCISGNLLVTVEGLYRELENTFFVKPQPIRILARTTSLRPRTIVDLEGSSMPSLTNKAWKQIEIYGLFRHHGEIWGSKTARCDESGEPMP